MCEDCTQQALPDEHYLKLLGIALCVFNANIAFLIENILRNDKEEQYTWYELIDETSSGLKASIKKTISRKLPGFEAKFDDIVERRNRIVHSFQITSEGGQQMLATKTRIRDGNQQFVITEDYLLEFIKRNDALSDSLHTFRGF